ncbi:MAG: hypothetical protein WAT66_00675 [Actinomycetota bacterium]
MRKASVLGVALLITGVSATAAYAVFQASRAVPSNSFSTAADWSPPTTSSSVIAKTTAGSAGYIKQGATYYVYANVTDNGNPASGVSTVQANVSTITTGQTAATLTAGSYTVDGTAYGYRTSSLTANGSLTAGNYTYAITSTDSGGHSATQSGFTVTVDNTAPSASDIQTANGGSIAGRAQQSDTITFTFSEAIDPASILAGWTGASTNVVVRLNDGGLIANDTVAIYNAANTSQLPLGSVDLGRTDYTSSNRTFGATSTASTMVMSGASITITLGTQSGAATTAGATGTMSWTPSATAKDRADNAMSTTARNETGTADKEF